MSEHRPHQDDAEQEELVAYLDGELDADLVRRIEDRLISDPVYRGRLQKLQKSWDMLDELPRAVATEAFTETTVGMVAVRVADDAMAETIVLRKKRSLQNGFGIAAAALALMGGFLGARYWLERDDRQLIEDLSVVERVDMYRNVDDIDFLRSLEREGLFVKEVE